MDSNGPGSSTPCGQGPSFNILSSAVSSSSSLRSPMTSANMSAGSSGSSLVAHENPRRVTYMAAECSGYNLPTERPSARGCASMLASQVGQTVPSEEEQSVGVYGLPSSTTSPDQISHAPVREASSPSERPSTTQGHSSKDHF
uniref:Uncharacterized protein n=1 Tax=Biomphalaria glabrata TaxID=6526 RepID=A0A2C9LVQ3_BIOGL